MRRCFFSSPILINDFPLSWHWCGLSPEWESKCKFSTKWISTFCTFVHYLSSVDITCVLRLAASANDFLQLEQVLALIPLWVSMCVYRVPAWPNNFRQWSQVYAFVLLWVTIRLSRPGPWNRVARVACPEDQRHLGGPRNLVAMSSKTTSYGPVDKINARGCARSFIYWIKHSRATLDYFG